MAIFSLKCPYCGTDNTAFIVQDFICHKESQKIATLFATCNKCNGGVVTDSISNASETFKVLIGVDGDLQHIAETRFFNIGEWLPKPKAIDIPQHLPIDVAKSFNEGCKVIGISNDGACSMFRKSIDIATKDLSKDSDGMPWKLEKRIEKLSSDGKITKDIAEWAHQIRIDGNDALHENNATKEDAEALRDLTKYVLTYLYTLPEQVRLARENSAVAKN